MLGLPLEEGVRRAVRMLCVGFQFYHIGGLYFVVMGARPVISACPTPEEGPVVACDGPFVAHVLCLATGPFSDGLAAGPGHSEASACRSTRNFSKGLHMLAQHI